MNVELSVKSTKAPFFVEFMKMLRNLISQNSVYITCPKSSMKTSEQCVNQFKVKKKTAE